MRKIIVLFILFIISINNINANTTISIYCPIGWCYVAQGEVNSTLLQLNNSQLNSSMQGHYLSSGQKTEMHVRGFKFNQNKTVYQTEGIIYYFTNATNVSVTIPENHSIDLNTGWNLVANFGDSSSSIYQEIQYYNITASDYYESPELAFDNDTNTYWRSTSHDIIPQDIEWLQIEQPEAIKIKMYRIFDPEFPSSYSPTNWTFEGSQDGENWTILDTVVDDAYNTSGTIHEINNEDFYIFYRVNMTSSPQGWTFAVSEIKMYESIISAENAITNGYFDTNISSWNTSFAGGYFIWNSSGQAEVYGYSYFNWRAISQGFQVQSSLLTYQITIISGSDVYVDLEDNNSNIFYSSSLLTTGNYTINVSNYIGQYITINFNIGFSDTNPTLILVDNVENLYTIPSTSCQSRTLGQLKANITNATIAKYYDKVEKTWLFSDSTVVPCREAFYIYVTSPSTWFG